jgi:hypothetical protein
MLTVMFYHDVIPNSFSCGLPSHMYRNLTGGLVRTAEVSHRIFNPLTPELNPSAQRCLPIFFPGEFKF